jgi:hypothetical protein
MIASAILDAKWAGILRLSPKGVAGAISRLVVDSVCGAFLGVICGPTRKGTLTPVSAVVSSAVVRAFCVVRSEARPQVPAAAAVKAGSRTEVRLP